jgi:predicted nuclease of predicted toxin-antitoxin system
VPSPAPVTIVAGLARIVMAKWVRLADPPKKQVPILRRLLGGRARYLVDESLGKGVAELLTDWGHNVKYGPSVGLGGHADEDVFAYGWRKGRMILTHDRDFLDDKRFPYTRNPGVIVLPGGDGNDRALLKTLYSAVGVFSTYSNVYPNAKIAIDSEGVWTVRSYDKTRGRVENETLKLTNGEVYSLVDD